MPWAHESAFRKTLRRIEAKATDERLQHAADLALADGERGADEVAALVLTEFWRRKPEYKVRLFYALSAIARRSVAVHGARSRYVPIWEGHLGAVAAQLERLSPEPRSRVARVLSLWWREGVFAPGVVHTLQARFSAATAAGPAPKGHPTPAASASASPWEDSGCTVIMMSRTAPSIETPASPPPPPPRFDAQ